MKFVFTLIALLILCGTALACPDVVLKDGNGVDLETGDVLTEDIRDVLLHNNMVRLQYQAHVPDFRDMGIWMWNEERIFDHVLAARHDDHQDVAAQGCSETGGACHTGGTHWHDAFWSWYGDGSRWAQFYEYGHMADELRVLEATPDQVRLAYVWYDLPHQGSGETVIDLFGAPVYEHNMGDVLKKVTTATVYKTVMLRACESGYWVSMRSNPNLTWEDQGERGSRLGLSSVKVSWACDGSEVAYHPAGQHVSLGTTDCVAGIPSESQGHDGWPFVQVLVTAVACNMRSLEYSDGKGSPGCDQLYDRLGPDGLPFEWQAFIGVDQYVPGPFELEPTSAAQTAAWNLIPAWDVWPY